MVGCEGAKSIRKEALEFVARCQRAQSLRLGDGDNGKSLDFVGVFAKKSGFNDNV